MVDFGSYMPPQPSFMDFANPAQNSQNNFLQQLLAGQPEIAQAVKPLAAPEPAAPARAPRERRSVLDTIGRVSDVLARVGGAEALYQPTLDARQDRTLGMEDRERKIQADEIALATGKFNLGGAQSVRLGQFARGLKAIGAGGGDINRALPILAQQMQLDPETVQMFQQAVATDPNALDGIIAATSEEKQQGSLPASIQNYAQYQRILAEQGPEAAEEFMRFAQPEMTAIKPYQEAQLLRDDREFRRQLIKDRREAREADREFRLKEEKAASGGADLTPTQRGVVTQKLAMLPVIKQQLKNVVDIQAEMQKEGTLARGALGGLVPGAIAGGKAEQFDKALGALRKSILSLTRTPGVGSMSNYETALDEMALPSRWGSDEGRAEALNGIDELVTGLEAGYREMVPKRQKPSTSRRVTPRTNKGSGKSTGGWSIVGVK